jgi:hypothetical protein
MTALNVPCAHKERSLVAKELWFESEEEKDE